MARRPRGRKITFSPWIGEKAFTPRGDEVVIVDRNRPNGVHGATVRYTDKDRQKAPDLGMVWFKVRDLYPHQLAEPYEVRYVTNPPPLAPPRALPNINTSNRPEPSKGALLARSTDLAGDSSGRKKTATTDGKPATVSRGARRGRRRKFQSTTRRTSMATTTSTRRRGRKAAAETEPEPKATGRKRGSSKAAATKETTKSNGGERRTHEDILALVPEIVKKLQNGTTMTDIREEYGAGPVIRKALWESGYNTKGEKIEVEDLSDLDGKKLADAVAELREDGKAWPYLEIATDMSAADLRELLEENGYGHLASGRVILTEEEAEPEPAPKKSSRRKGSAKAEAEPEATPAAKRGRRRQSNPS